MWSCPADSVGGMAGPYPFVTVPILKEKPWGGTRLSAYGKQAGPGARTGESWEVADLAPDVAGTPDGERSPIANGALAGCTIADAVAAWGVELLGDGAAAPTGGFPLLVKLLDAGEPLSVQVHPDAAYASTHPGTHAKSESWYVVDADEGAVLYLGLAVGVDAAALAAACDSGEVEDVLHAVPARPGDLHHVAAGTVHALGGGVLVAEVQTPSDTTFRLYDWHHRLDRPRREMHLSQAIEAIAWEAAAPADVPFEILPRRLDGPLALAGQTCHVVMVLRGAATLGDLALAPGDTAVVPAACLPATITGRADILDVVVR